MNLRLLLECIIKDWQPYNHKDCCKRIKLCKTEIGSFQVEQFQDRRWQPSVKSPDFKNIIALLNGEQLFKIQVLKSEICQFENTYFSQVESHSSDGPFIFPDNGYFK